MPDKKPLVSAKPPPGRRWGDLTDEEIDALAETLAGKIGEQLSPTGAGADAGLARTPSADGGIDEPPRRPVSDDTEPVRYDAEQDRGDA